MDDTTPTTLDADTARRRRTLRTTVIAAAAAGGLAIAGGAIAAAQTSSGNGSTTTTAPVAGANPAAPPQGQAAPGGPGRGGPRMKGGPGRPGGPGGMMGGIHGELVRPDGKGGYQTVDTQVGTVTAVSTSSITIKSEDGFSKTYAVDTGTMVDAGRDGIANVKSGDTVHVTAIVTGGTAKAVEVMDQTNMKALHDQWNPKPPAPGAQPGTSSSGPAA